MGDLNSNFTTGFYHQDSGEDSNCFTVDLKKADGVTGISSRKCPGAKREEDMNKRWHTDGSSPLLK